MLLKSATQTNLRLFGDTQSASCSQTFMVSVSLCWDGAVWVRGEDGSEGVPFQRSMHSFISAGRRLRTLWNVPDKASMSEGSIVRSRLRTRQFDTNFSPSSGSHCPIPVSTYNRPPVYSVNNIKPIEWFLFFFHLKHMVVIISLKVGFVWICI